MEINDELLELQEYDDVTEARREAAKLKKGTNSRQRALPEDLREDQISRVDQFVEEKSCAVSERVKVCPFTQTFRDAVARELNAAFPRPGRRSRSLRLLLLRR